MVKHSLSWPALPPAEGAQASHLISPPMQGLDVSFLGGEILLAVLTYTHALKLQVDYSPVWVNLSLYHFLIQLFF